ncbi:unnamed protein product [Rotaria magnacalcarata]|uniref:Uncharacterized protein n=1 Tax=Rotaria magnacalcarata TaxID=392030 RepID=A0A815B7E6_9BILA|nr:unnamed protein product [Rotaria magnacalcarata]CAF1335175.1 unnamed protein product [Rotaria magnacalcarata]CAF2058236.1 unnamed protein product [Rotaria magnacalcarata]CAF2132746.1 unnamed protein product [Rotaria magnacalcarata]CAF2143407.1 unnamed protein product [Rotaria magnacalcarata]
MLLTTVTFFILIIIGSLNCLCTQSKCTAQETDSTCCFQIGCCPASNNVCCPNDPTSCCSIQYPVCCGIGKGCCLRDHPVCCPTHCCSSGSYCCGKKCCRRRRSLGLHIEAYEGTSKMNQYQKQ